MKHSYVTYKKRRQISDINVTPMVDVMLVLIVIFMVTAPMLTVGVPVHLPQAKAKPVTEKKDALTISVNEKGIVFLQNTPVTLEALLPRLKAASSTAGEMRIFMRADHHISYGKVIEIMGILNAAGYDKIALLTKPDNR